MSLSVHEMGSQSGAPASDLTRIELGAFPTADMLLKTTNPI